MDSKVDAKVLDADGDGILSADELQALEDQVQEQANQAKYESELAHQAATADRFGVETEEQQALAQQALARHKQALSRHKQALARRACSGTAR